MAEMEVLVRDELHEIWHSAGIGRTRENENEKSRHERTDQASDEWL